jgi:hypothetical protein
MGTFIGGCQIQPDSSEQTETMHTTRLSPLVSVTNPLGPSDMKRAACPFA